MANSDWMNSDIYDVVDTLDNLKKKYITDQEETTLSLGIFGFIADTEAKKIQTSIIRTGQLGNEMFPTRANLTRNVLTHAIYSNIGDINAKPSHITLNIGVRLADIDEYSKNDVFTIDCTTPIFVGDYEFHFDYDVILTRYLVDKNADIQNRYTYSAHYKVTDDDGTSIDNRLSSIVDPYLKQPFVILIDNEYYLIFQATLHQYSIETIEDTFSTDSIIINKSYTFDFQNQLADFDVFLTTNGKTTCLKPYFYGSALDKDVKDYCWYLYTADNTVRITFDNGSTIPGLNTDIKINVYTTLGEGGIFEYTNIDSTSEGFYIEINSEKYNYSAIKCFAVATTDSTDGSDRKSKAVLQELIPKANLSRGSITSDTDINNYFNLINTDTNRLKMQKKVDNQLERIWYAYFLLKDDLNNVIPTNTVSLDISVLDKTFVTRSADGRYMIPAGTFIKYDPDTKLGVPIDQSEIPTLYSKDYFDGKYYYYMTIYSIFISREPLYAAFYLSATNTDTYFVYKWVNEKTNLQFVANKINYTRKLLSDKSTYTLTFSIAQSLKNDFKLFERDKDTDEIIRNDTMAVIVFYKNNIPYRWKKATLKDIDDKNYIYTYTMNLNTDNNMDTSNNLKIVSSNDDPLYVIGSNSDNTYAYFAPNTKAIIYILAKFSDGSYGRYDFDTITPGYEDYTVTNIYTIDGGINFYQNYTGLISAKITPIDEDIESEYKIDGIPLVGAQFMNSEDNSVFLIDAIGEKRAYIDYCLQLIENNMSIDFKFFNTYGPSCTYSLKEDDDSGLIDHVDLSLNFRMELSSTTDVYTESDVKKDIKAYIENLDELGDLHFPNLITYIKTKYADRIVFIEFTGFNQYEIPDKQHIYLLNPENAHIVPEFLNVRTILNESTGELIPDINIELV